MSPERAAAPAPACLIRTGSPGDEAALALLGQASFLEAFAGTLRGADILEHCAHKHAREVYRHWLADAHYDIWIAEARQGGAQVGYLVMCPPTPAELPLADLDERDAEIKRIYLLHRFQGLGLGAALLRSARERATQRAARRLVLGVYAGNAAAIAFYQAQGFCTVGRRSFRVGESDCEDLILACTL
ncbi:MAG TPA: GNAT family N-acetyltransferase [Steroidobacteraceae bacterium]|nr:GNAT family N-acetyltransferase [Steroidobacteraceae bacterium]